MNGRVEDAITGRFLSADPNIPDLSNTQDYNRYTYVDNNPLTNADPSGFATCDSQSAECVDVGSFGGGNQSPAPYCGDDCTQTVATCYVCLQPGPPPLPDFLPDPPKTIFPGPQGNLETVTVTATQSQCHSYSNGKIWRALANNTQAHGGFGVGLGDTVKLGFASLDLSLEHIYFGTTGTLSGNFSNYISWGGPAPTFQIGGTKFGFSTTQHQTTIRQTAFRTLLRRDSSGRRPPTPNLARWGIRRMRQCSISERKLISRVLFFRRTVAEIDI